jgi:uncharacterized protein involved in type VI secretion and phage assembly
MSLENIVANLVQKVERRFYGKYRGFVVDNADPEHLGRLKVKVPSVLGSDVVTGWAAPCVPYGGSPDQGFLFIPDIDAGVWVEFEEGDLEFPIWVGTFWSKPGGESELPKPNDNVQDPPTQKIIKTKKGHTIQLEDADGEEKIIIKHKDKSFISIDKDGSVIIGNNKGSTIILNAKEENMVVVEQHGNSINMTEKGVTIVNNDGSAALELGADMARLIAKNIVLQGSSVALGADAMEPTIMGQSFKALWDTFIMHTHPTGTGPSGPPVPPGMPLMPGKDLTSAVVVK